MTSAQMNVHYCGAFPCSVCGAGYAPGVFRASPPGRLSDEDVERIADRVVAKMSGGQITVSVDGRQIGEAVATEYRRRRS